MHRKVAFSGKRKKEQLQLKRQVKDSRRHLQTATASDGDTTEDAELQSRKLMEQPQSSIVTATSHSSKKDVNRYNLQFFQESKKELERLRLEGFVRLRYASPIEREIDAKYFENFDFPIRPKWDYAMDKDTLDSRENRYFREYVERLQKLSIGNSQDLSLFELNLETWRQLWRVLEFSDILLIIVDVRYSTLMFPPSLHEHIIYTLKKHAILVLNKVDLVAPEVVVAWRDYFQKTYPGLPVVLFASYPAKALKGTTNSRLGHKRSMEGVYNIYRECHKIVQSEVDLTSWEQKILEDMRTESTFLESATHDPSPIVHSTDGTAYGQPHKLYRDGILTIGCIGFPNVGKSSLINALKGRKVVSVSHTPGHTKHWQTIFLTHSVRLCDCPGLVFPSATPKYLQVLFGSYPISQLQVPYHSLKFLAENLDLPQLLKLQLPEDFDEWSAAAIADAWALKRGFLTAKTAHPDRYRAANHLLRMCLAGQYQLMLQFYPPGFHKEKENWLAHPEVEEVRKYQNPQKDEKDVNTDASLTNSESDDVTSSNDETNADEETDEQPSTKSLNVFALLQDN